MGAAGSISYRSSAQEWLDEKKNEVNADRAPVCHVPFALHLVSKLTRLDEITGNRQSQSFFPIAEAITMALNANSAVSVCSCKPIAKRPGGDTESPGFTLPCLQKRWFHTGQAVDASRGRYHRADKQAVKTGQDTAVSVLP